MGMIIYYFWLNVGRSIFKIKIENPDLDHVHDPDYVPKNDLNSNYIVILFQFKTNFM
jgi:hypothetical protein